MYKYQISSQKITSNLIASPVKDDGLKFKTVTLCLCLNTESPNIGVPPIIQSLDHFTIETHGDDWGSSISRTPPCFQPYTILSLVNDSMAPFCNAVIVVLKVTSFCAAGDGFKEGFTP